MDHDISMQDRAFRQALESFAIAPGDFDHRAHVRLAYIYLCEQSVTQAQGSMKRALLAFLAHLGIGEAKYHETMTQAWIMAVAHFMRRSAPTASADAFIERNPELLDARIMLTHYSAETLFSAAARSGFVEPDVQRIPVYQE